MVYFRLLWSLPIDSLLCIRNRRLRTLLMWARNEIDRIELVENVQDRLNIQVIITMKIYNLMN
jgi:hypothetical protein